MAAYVASQFVKAMLKRRIKVDVARVLILGLTFKENCPDLCNTGVVDVVVELRDYGVQVDVYDPWADSAEALREYGLALVKKPECGEYDGVMLAVSHDNFREAGASKLRAYGRTKHVFFDLKSAFQRADSDLKL
jgi:UDP-N-acetyl-D-galactosamine dehydrogenase